MLLSTDGLIATPRTPGANLPACGASLTPPDRHNQPGGVVRLAPWRSKRAVLRSNGVIRGNALPEHAAFSTASGGGRAPVPKAAPIAPGHRSGLHGQPKDGERS